MIINQIKHIELRAKELIKQKGSKPKAIEYCERQYINCSDQDLKQTLNMLLFAIKNTVDA
jgi:hypothetical protein